MHCEKIKESLLDYLDGMLSIQEVKSIEAHIKECHYCSREFEEVKSTIDYLKEAEKKITIPTDFMDSVKEKVKANQSTTAPIKLPNKFRTLAIAAVMMALFVVSAFATDGFGLFIWWRELSVRESRSVYELLEEGYGDQVNLIAIDQNIKVTVESVLADDIKTILLLEIEDLQGENPYITTRDGTRFEGSFEYDENVPEEFPRDPNFSLLTLHSEEHHKRKLLLNLDPLTEKESTISFNIKEFKNATVGSDEVIKGNWDFEISVKKYDVATYEIHQELEIDGNTILIEELVVGPTATLLTYSYNPNQNREYTLEYFSDISLRANGREYQSRFLGGISTSSSGGRRRDAEATIEFDTMYLDNPKEVEVKIGGYNVHVKANAYQSFDIDIEEGFPQQFQYKNSSIIIEEMIIGEDSTEVLLREPLENRNYEMLEVEFRTTGGITVWSRGDWEEFYFVDREGNQVEVSNDSYWYYLMKMKNPKMYVTKTRFLLNRTPSYEKLPEELWGPPEIIPTALVIRGYKETRWSDGSIKIKLK